MVFHCELGENKSPQVSRTLLSKMAGLNNSVVWIVSTRPFISKSFSFIINTLVTVPRALIIFGTTVTLMFRSFFSSLARSWYLSFLSLSFSFTQWQPE